MRLVDIDPIIQKLFENITFGKLLEYDTSGLESVLKDIVNLPVVNDLISRQAAIEVLEWFDQTDPLGYTPVQIVRALPTAEPSAQPEVKEIGYAECANAMLKMWIDNVVTDGEYNRVMDKLNTHWGKEAGND